MHPAGEGAGRPEGGRPSAHVTQLEAPPWTVWVVDTGTHDYLTSALYPDLRQGGPADVTPLPHNAVVLHDGEHLVLLDTGLPAESARGGAPVVHALAALGFSPSDVDTVVLSHLHPDHIGAYVSAAPDVPFPRAETLVDRHEWAYFSDEANLRQHRGRVADAVRVALPVIAASRLTLVSGSFSPVTGVVTRPAAGHTPGHRVVELGEPATYLYVADLVADRRQLRRPRLRSGFDRDPVLAEAARAGCLTDARDRGLGIIGAHLADSGPPRTIG